MPEENKGFFWTGWKPAMRWVLLTGMGYEFVLRPILPWALKAVGFQHIPDPPELSAHFWKILLSVMGIG